MSKKFSALDILNRASEYGIVVSVRDNSLALDVPTTLATSKRDKALAVIKANNASILAYLRELEQTEPLCFTCLDNGSEIRGEHEHEGLMYCEQHLPCRKKCKASSDAQLSLF